MPTFATSFTPPATPAGLTVTAEPELSRVLLGWTSTSLGVDFAGYRIYRQRSDETTATLIATINSESANAFADYEVPVGVSVTYSLTVSSLDFESDPAQGTTLIEPEVGWWLVDPAGDPGRIFDLRYVTGWSTVGPLEHEDFHPLGRPRALRLRGEVLGEGGKLSIEAPPDVAPALWPKLRAAQDPPGEYVLLKSPFGEVFRVNLGNVDRTRGDAGAMLFAVAFVEVD